MEKNDCGLSRLHDVFVEKQKVLLRKKENYKRVIARNNVALDKSIVNQTIAHSFTRIAKKAKSRKSSHKPRRSLSSAKYLTDKINRKIQKAHKALAKARRSFWAAKKEYSDGIILFSKLHQITDVSEIKGKLSVRALATIATIPEEYFDDLKVKYGHIDEEDPTKNSIHILFGLRSAKGSKKHGHAILDRYLKLVYFRQYGVDRGM